MKKGAKIALVAVAAVFAAAGIAFGGYWHHNMHWYDEYEENLKKVGAVEKQYTLPNGRVINYGEVENDNPPLLLIHGQMSIWQDYALVLPALSEKWHIYSVDVYGHGASSHSEDLYYIDVNGDDIICFINDVIGKPTVVAGHSNGRQQYWSGLPCPPPGDLPDPGIQPTSPLALALQADSLPQRHQEIPY